jgi:hypothetical protein
VKHQINERACLALDIKFFFGPRLRTRIFQAWVNGHLTHAEFMARWNLWSAHLHRLEGKRLPSWACG